MMMGYEEFKKEVYRISGINLSLYKENQMKRRLDSLITKNNFDGYSSYIAELKVNTKLYNEFINFMTINVSEFYRNPEQWTKLKSVILPMLMQESKTLTVWSAACSSGDEPYTLVMVLNQFLPLDRIKIIATDIDDNILQKAKEGIYLDKSVLNLPADYKHKYFDVDGSLYKVKSEVKRCVNFKHHNLLADEYPKGCDLIVCRNVLIYFTEEAKVDIYQKFNDSLRVGGVLFVGSTEQIIMCSKYNFKSLQTFFYQKEGASV